MLPYNPNRIKQSDKCCVYCGKNYKSNTGLDKHIVLCEILSRSNKKDKEDEIVLPSQKQMYSILMELAGKYKKLEEKVEKMNKFMDVKKINVLDWLSENSNPEYLFDDLPNKITIFDKDVEFLFHNNGIDTLNEILCREIDKTNAPLFASSIKPKVLYIYEKEWCELPKEKLTKFLNTMNTKIIKMLTIWKQLNNEKMNANSTELYNKAVIKVINLDFKKENIVNRVRSVLLNHVKTEM